jgi:hypothetical protein
MKKRKKSKIYKQNPKLESTSKPDAKKLSSGDFLKMIAQLEPEMVADGLNAMFKSAGQDVNLTPGQVMHANFELDDEVLKVEHPVLPGLSPEQIADSVRESAERVAEAKRPPITPEQLKKDMDDYSDMGVQFMGEDKGHGTMFFPYLNGAPIALIGIADANFNDLEEGLYHAARIRVESLPDALEGFIIIAQAWVVVATPTERVKGGLSKHPKRQQALVVAGAHAGGWRHTICTIFDENWEVMARMTSENPHAVLVTDNMVKHLADACFDPDTKKWQRVIDAYNAKKKRKK